MRKMTWALLALIFASSPTSAFAQSNLYTFPGPDVDLGPSYLGRVVSGGHYIGGRGDTVYVLREFGHTYCHKSTDGGQTFGPGIRINSTAGAYNASLKVDTTGVVYVAYQSDDADIYFTKSTDGGETFTPGVKVNDDTIPQTGQEKPVIAVNNKGQIFIAWRDQRNSAPQTHQSLFASASYDRGVTFLSNVQINDIGINLGGSIDLESDDTGHVYVVWMPERRGILLSRSDDSGQSFLLRAEVADVPFDSTVAGSGLQSIALSGSVVGVAWQDLRFEQYSIRYSFSINLGDSFSASSVIDSSDQPQKPSLVWSEDIFYVVWRATHRRTPTGWDLNHIWFSYGPDSGQTFVPRADAVPDDTNFVPHFNPTIWVNDNKKAFVAWTDARWDPVFQEDHHLFVSVGIPVVAKGDLNMDGNITLADIVLELNAVFLGSPFPAPFETADGNCDGNLSSADITLLLLAVFLNFPFPCS